ncbi:hypothetical protein HN695_00245 [Candidatus Woesearchaeota archaeon]|jgi:hypothetical protein|nr:hypothetical protein [Candidatus Woesearchaeota archaeon]MBT5272550.1 hypothetical protein [Candidatus Woesearchaeota archaeon]MBT6041301.1 hypothetical protein [Candidatus Woesearchaeota archaeon]MBT6337102.1 hypothetical protein [Candidatus Woesearchaeota archaeon]MBT7926743.1 hypothetical protein [Candidatus Woesearchaeota archaeon]
MKQTKSKNTLKNLFTRNKTAYIDSWKNINVSYIWTILLDISFILIVVMIYMFGYAKLGGYLQGDLIPAAQEYGLLKEETMKDSSQIDIQGIKELAEKHQELGSEVYSSTYKIAGLLIALILLMGFISTAYKTITWSFIRQSFKRFWKFFLYNLIFLLIWLIIFLPPLFFVKESLIMGWFMLMLVMYIYLSPLLTTKFNTKKPIFKQLFENLKYSITNFYHLAIPFVIAIISLGVLISIPTLLNPILPSVIEPIVALIIVFFAISWSRRFIYYYNEVQGER